MVFSFVRHPTFILHLRSTRNTPSYPESYVFGMSIVLTHISTYTLRDGGRRVEYLSEHYPPTRNLPKEFTLQAVLNLEILPLENCIDIKIPHPKPIFWCNYLDLPQERLASEFSSEYNVVPHVRVILSKLIERQAR